MRNTLKSLTKLIEAITSLLKNVVLLVLTLTLLIAVCNGGSVDIQLKDQKHSASFNIEQPVKNEENNGRNPLSSGK